jgi:DNA-binding MarR family transcriptional regulator
MKTQVHPNSIEAYHGIDLNESQAAVVRALLFLGEATDLQIAAYLKISINRVTGRITELRDKGAVIEIGTKTGGYGKQVRINRLVKFSEELSFRG